MARCALKSRERAVPGGMPSVSAISVGHSPSDAVRGSPVDRAAAGGTRVRAGPDRRGRAGRRARSARRPAAPEGSSPGDAHAASRIHTLTRTRRSHASNRSGSRSPRRSRRGDHQCVLQGVLGPIDVAEDLEGDPEQPLGAQADQVHEGCQSPRRAAATRSRSIRLPSARQCGADGGNGAPGGTSVHLRPVRSRG